MFFSQCLQKLTEYDIINLPGIVSLFGNNNIGGI